MRCLKCGYISFDYNQICPKCNKDISEYLEMMNIPSFRPNPPSLLGALIGETDESDMGIDISGSHEPILGSESEGAFDESFEIDEGMGLDSEPDTNMALGADAEDIAPEESVEISEEEDVLDLDLQTEEEETSVDPGAMTSEEPPLLESVAEPEVDDSEIALDLEDLSFESEETEPVEVPVEEPEEEIPAGLDDITLDEGQDDFELDLGEVKEEEQVPEVVSEEVAREEKSVTDEIELKLDDLKINETGDLEIEAVTKDKSPTDETSIDNNELDLSDESQETEDISLDESPKAEEDSLDKNMGLDDLISAESGSNEEITQEPTLDLNLDLDNMDLDLDLDNLEEK